MLLGKEKKSAVDGFNMPQPKAFSTGTDYKKNIHKVVRVVKGAHKGLVGRVLGVREKENIPFYEVELIAKLKKITIEVSKTKLEEEVPRAAALPTFAEDTFNAETPLHVSQTPMIGGETPSIYGGDTPRVDTDENDPFHASDKDFEPEFAPRRTSRFSSAASDVPSTSAPPNADSSGWGSSNSFTSGGWGNDQTVATSGWGSGSLAADSNGLRDSSALNNNSAGGWGGSTSSTQDLRWNTTSGASGWGGNSSALSSTGWGNNTSMQPMALGGSSPANQPIGWGNITSPADMPSGSGWGNSRGWGASPVLGTGDGWRANQNLGSNAWGGTPDVNFSYGSSPSPSYMGSGKSCVFNL